MTNEQLLDFSKVLINGKSYAIIQALSDGFCLAIEINGVDEQVSDVKIIKVQ